MEPFAQLVWLGFLLALRNLCFELAFFAQFFYRMPDTRKIISFSFKIVLKQICGHLLLEPNIVVVLFCSAT